MKNIKYLIVGIIFGIVFVKAEIISWFRIQEMFFFDSFHMYGVIGTAIITAMISIFIIKRFNIKTLEGEKITIPNKEFRKGQVYGGLIFGIGWSITGACPGPIFAIIGSGYSVILVTLLFAVLGTWVYGKFKDYFPS